MDRFDRRSTFPERSGLSDRALQRVVVRLSAWAVLTSDKSSARRVVTTWPPLHARRLSLAFLLVLWTGLSEGGGPFYGRVVAVHDGDTLTVLDSERHQHRIRLYQIDAPEKGQDYGASSKKSLSDLVYRRDVTVMFVATDRYHRDVGTVLLGGTDINLLQVERGMAWVYQRYAKDPAYFAAERAARTARRGLWKDPKPTPPWEFRRADRGEFDLWRWFRH